ncbi:hypothetical protein [Labrenzia sp. OB1]|uniref:hypothetical protein n=1 Tax=Labrenzia sp. OB1 TaxID=1561204 RepID=UPI0007B18A4D|nr:hypothetical protein [Labrenzia sp. OB1]KZM49453.1 hypothetical protein OA90_15370 [Labrenzia sp. OB1]
MIEPVHILNLIEADPVSLAALAISSVLEEQLQGVAVRSHPGKLDIYDVVSRDLVKSPGIALGWTQIRAMRQTAGHYCLPVEFAAYVVVEDLADRQRGRRFPRERVAHAIGTRLLAILNDPDLADWGLANIGLPESDPAPVFRPMFTATAYQKGTAYYAVTWTQELVGLGPDFLAGATPAFTVPDEERGPGLKFPDDAGIPPEIAAMIEEDRS